MLKKLPRLSFYGSKRRRARAATRTDSCCTRRWCQIWIARETPRAAGAHHHKVRTFSTTTRAKRVHLFSHRRLLNLKDPRSSSRHRPIQAEGLEKKSPKETFEVVKMRQELEMLLVIWSLLVVSLGTGFPTRHKSVGHKVSWRTFLIYGFKNSLVWCRSQVSRIDLLNYIPQCFTVKPESS